MSMQAYLIWHWGQGWPLIALGCKDHYNNIQAGCNWMLFTAGNKIKVLYMSFDRFLLAVDSRDLSQADKSIIRVSSFPSFNFWMINYSYTQKSYLALWQNCFVQFITQKFPSLKSKQFSQFFLLRGKSEKIESIHFAESSDLSCWETEKEVLLPIT